MPEQRAADLLPMWVADMDFRVAPPIIDALRTEAEMGVLGYGGTPVRCSRNPVISCAGTDAGVLSFFKRRYCQRAPTGSLVKAHGIYREQPYVGLFA
ncbi:MAG: hypothetical protein M0003_15190 [Acidithiobacillus sp.]|jgi:hypothetical protein|uniref:hypothetical protein n=1 Tax=Acidithiobacillus ferrooxidans TaxID=920 RepID=UPI001D001C33|nr:hypothetical protein [Acidithiobacillus ferrooxidans]MDA8154031.1 hypothetical protein [Acidithiobacillus sp.]